MNLEKIITKNKHLSLKALGLISYIAIVHGSMEDLNRKILSEELKIGKDAFKSAFDELMNADILQLYSIGPDGRFRFTYIVNEFYL